MTITYYLILLASFKLNFSSSHGRSIMKKQLLLVVLCGVLTACGGSGGNGSNNSSGPLLDATGTWKGTYISSLAGSRTATVILVQNSVGTLTGNYSSTELPSAANNFSETIITAGGLGNITGAVSGGTATFTIAVAVPASPTAPACTGSLSGTGIINTSVTPRTMAFSYKGVTTCGGSESGTGNLIKQ